MLGWQSDNVVVDLDESSVVFSVPAEFQYKSEDRSSNDGGAFDLAPRPSHRAHGPMGDDVADDGEDDGDDGVPDQQADEHVYPGV